jgi:gliding motility-associated-like protein
MKKNDIEDLFKDSFENFEAEVSPGVWSNIQTALKGVGIGLLGKALLNKIGTNTVVAVISSAAAVISTVVIMNWGSKPENKPVAEARPAPKTMLEKSKPVPAEEIRKFLSTSSSNTNAPAMKPQPAASEEKAQSEAANKGAISIKKDKINEVISEYSTFPVASISANPIAGTVPLIVNVSNNGTGKINKWSFGDGQKESGANPVHVYATPGIYTIALASTGADGKTTTDSVKIEVYGNSSIPSAPKEFTPNGDGNQDILSFKPVNMISMSVLVFDKHGTIYYKSESLDAKWDGTDLKGQKAREGVYFVIQAAVGVDGKKYEQKGTISLTR